MNLDAILAALAAAPGLAMITTALALAVADFAVAVAVAVREQRFEAALIAGWLETHLVGRVLPIVVLAVLPEPLFAIAGLALATYTVETIASLRRNLFVDDAPGA